MNEHPKFPKKWGKVDGLNLPETDLASLRDSVESFREYLVEVCKQRCRGREKYRGKLGHCPECELEEFNSRFAK